MTPAGSDAALHLAIVGGGLAGLAAAVRATELGLRVMVLEQGEGERYPCNSRYAGGMFHLDYHDIARPADELAASLLARAPDDVDAGLVELVARNALRAVTWLRENGGARFFRVGPAPYEKWVLAPPRPPKPHLDWPGRGPDVVLRTLARRLAAAGTAVQTRHRVIGVESCGRNYRVTAATPDGSRVVEAAAVLFADGGFQSNSALLRASISPAPDQVLQRNAGTGIGISVGLAASLGAELSELQSFYGHLVARRALESAELWPYPMIDGLGKSGILVGRDGSRFVDEGRTGVYMANAVARRADPAECCVVFDDAVWRTVGRETRVPPNPVLLNRGGELLSAGSLTELEQRAGIAPGGLVSTVAAFNAAVRDGDGGSLSPPRTLGAAPRPIEVPPFHAVPVCAGITYTMGGLRIDSGARLRAAAGGSLPGLYAAGAAVGGIEGGRFSFYMGGLTKALVLGLTAAESAAADLTRPAAAPALQLGDA